MPAGIGIPSATPIGTSSPPAITPGKMFGSVTLMNVVLGSAPRSPAASSSDRSIPWTRARTVIATNDTQNIVCASRIVVNPCGTRAFTNIVSKDDPKGATPPLYMPAWKDKIKGEELEATDYYAKLYEKLDLLEIDRSFTSRAVNEGFSGGEKKRCEILQMAMLDPRYAVLDETDSGLDIDALKVVASGVNSLRGPNLGVLLITHYQRLLNYIVPDFVHVMVQGRIVRSGGKELALELEEKGYDWIREHAEEPVTA